MVKALRPLLDEVFVSADVSGTQTKKSGDSTGSNTVSDTNSATWEIPPSTASGNSLDDRIEAAIKVKEVEAGIGTSQQPSPPSLNKGADKNSLFNDLANSLIDLEKDN